jgi:hypothetical protein
MHGSDAQALGFDDETSPAVGLLSRDTGKTVQQLAYEAFTDLLAKHHRRAP